MRVAQVLRSDLRFGVLSSLNPALVYVSCTGFLAHVASSKFGFDTAPVAELIHWANIVDGALYESPESAVEMAAPAMKLTLVIESTQDPHFVPRLIPLLTEMPLADVLSQPFVADLLPPLLLNAPDSRKGILTPGRKDAKE